VWRFVLVGSILSALVFFSASFLTILSQISSPPHVTGRFELSIGFPYTYYREFIQDGMLYHGWIAGNLIKDCGLTWLVVTGIFVVVKRLTR
jgi:hypothetical protein